MLDATETPQGPGNSKPPCPSAVSYIGPCGPIGVWHSTQWAIGPAMYLPYSTVGPRGMSATCSTGGP